MSHPYRESGQADRKSELPTTWLVKTNNVKVTVFYLDINHAGDELVTVELEMTHTNTVDYGTRATNNHVFNKEYIHIRGRTGFLVVQEWIKDCHAIGMYELQISADNVLLVPRERIVKIDVQLTRLDLHLPIQYDLY